MGSYEPSGLSVLNSHATRLSGPSLLHELVQPSCSETLPALEYFSGFEDRISFSYRQLHELSDSLAATISQWARSLPEDSLRDQFVVPLMIPQSPQLYIAQLAILKAGGAFCPLNLDAPVERIKFILDDVHARLVLVSPSHKARIPEHSRITTICVDDFTHFSSAAFDGKSHDSARVPTEQDLAYVMYTSGSTGMPKGVAISHLAATQSLLAHDRHLPSFSRFLQFAAPTFDVSVFEIYFPLFRGSTLVCCDRASMLTDLPGIIRKLNVDACELTPSVAGSLLKSRANAPCLRLLLTIGEMLTQPVVDEFAGGPEHESLLWGMYGPTEATIHCTLQPAFSNGTTPKCIGFPLDTVSAFVIGIPEDDKAHTFELLPIGQAGELAVGGFQLATGYINRPEQTKAAFIHTDFGMVYKTGDKALMRPDGTIECLGRVAEGQVKLNGQRLELGEIEHAILRTDGCHSAFVCVLSNLLVAFTAVESEAGMEERIINTCHDWLPAFMIPADIIILQSFPRLPSGKIDRQRLKQDYVASQSRIADGSTSDDALLLLLCGIAGDVLGSAVSSDTRLASAGMDSLSSIDFATRIREQGYQVTTLAVLNAKTVYDLYSQIQGQVSESGSTHSMCNETGSLESDDLFQALAADPVYKARLGDIRRVWKCTSLQVSMLSETLRDPRLYVNAMEVAFPKGTAATSVKNWLSDIAAQNEIVRSGFVHSEHSLVQVVWDSLLPTQVVAVEEFGETPIEPVSFLERPLQVQIVGETPEHGPLMRMRLHHALYDGWSFDLLLDDLDLLSQRERLPPRPQFRHIAPQIDADGLHQADAAAYEFWADYLRGAANSQVPNFRTVAVASPAILSSSWEVLLDPQTARYTASRLGVSSQAIFQACLSWMWSAITGSEDITFGSVFSGRTANIPGIERVFGPCIQTLPLRVKIGESRTIDDLIHHLHSTTRQMLQLPALSLSKIKNSVDIPPGSRLFDLLFVYQESLSTRNRRPESVKETWHMDYSETKLILEVAPGHDRFICKWTWHTDCFPTSQVEALSESFSHLVHYFFGNPERQLNSILPSFPNTLLSEYGLELRPVASDTTIVKLVEKAVERSPRTCALCFADSITASGLASRDLSYEELNGTANKIARRLLAQGLVPGGLVAIVMEKSPMLYCGILGILKAGCAYLPILPSTPVKRIQLIFDQAQPQLCLVEDPSLLDLRALESMPGWRSPDHRSRTTLLDVGFSVLDQYDSSNLEAAQDASQLAYVIYTSGTTGTPKGVAVTNKNLVSNITVLSRIYPHDHGSRMLQACSQAFDVSVFEIFFAWANGMCLCAATNDTLFESLELSIRQMEVTHLSMTVTVASLVNPDNVPGVKFLVTSGEPMTDEVLKKWANVLYQGYGPSETTNICTVRKVSKGDSAPYLGWSFENTSSIVLSPESDDAVPIGYIGELCFGGEQVAAGYLNMPELTASKFPEHPRYGRLYRSGDLGRMLPDGSLIISGRIDTQIKLRGQRIELQDTHSAIFKSAFAKACASLLVDRQSSRSQQLVTFYVPLEEAPGDFSVLPFTSSRRQLNMAISQMLRATLPAYMIPTFLVPISSVPLTSSGKVDARELRQTFESMPEASLSEFSSEVQTADDATKWTATERLLAQVLTEILAIDPTLVNRWVSLNSLGLDSISAITFARKLQDALHRRVPISLILQSGSVARLAQSLQAADLECTEENQSQWLSSSVIANVKERFTSQENAHAIESILPCTPLQEAMLASSSSTSDGLSYCNQMLFRLHQDPQQIIGHWEEMHQRHGILRTCFMSTETTAFPVVQVVMASFAPAWKYWRSVDMDQCILEQMKSIQNAIDTFRPPISLAIICTSQNEKYLSFVCHHAMYDGIAIDILLSEIESSARDLPLLPTVSFGPFLREALNLPPDTGQFWAEHLLSFAPQQLPQDIRSSQSAVRRDDASTSLTRDLDVPFDTMEERIRELGGSLLSLCQAAWAMSLSAVLQVPDVCFGNVISGRSINQDGIERLVAPCFNTIPLRTDLSALASNRAVVNHFRKLNADILPYQFTPLRRIRASTGLNDAALFETVLLLQPTPRQLDSSIWELEQESGSMGVPLICEVVPSNHNNKLTTTLHRDSACFSERVAMLLQDLFAHFMDVCLRLPSSQLSLSSNLPIDFEGLPSSTHLTTSSPEPDSESSPVPHGAWSETEQKIRVVVAKLSKMPETRIERQTSFYRLGLDSIAIVQLAFLLRQNNLDVSAVDVLAKPTCAAVALLCASQQSAHGASTYSYDLAAFTQRTRDSVRQANLPFKAEKVLPCTPLQQGMISQFLFSKGQSYFNYVSWTLDQDVDTARLKSAWELAVRRHEILRAGFLSVTHPDTPFAMVVYGHCDASAPVECISGERWHKADIEKWRIDCSKRALHELYRPPWNVALVQWPNGKEMHLAMHHALYDASSLKELLEDLNLLLKDTEPRAPSPLDRTILPLLSQVYEEKTEAENFWSRKASELVVNTFPTMTPLRIEPQKALTTSRECSLKNSVLRERAAQGETTIQAALQAALTRLLASYLGENAVTFGVVLNSRPGETRDGALFPQLATLPVIARHFDSNRQILDSMMEHNASLRRFINTPLSQVQKWLGHSGAPLFDTLLVYQPYEQQLPTSQPWRVIDEWATVDYPLSLEAEESASGSMRFNLVFQPHILPKEQADLFLSQFDALFTQLLDSPEGNAQQVAEKHQSLFSILPAEYAELPSKVYLLHQFVELNAVDFPQSPALDFVEDLDDADRRRHWNYRELNECGNQIANLLVSQGVRPGGIVAVCFDKCPEAYLAILGILKAGCAFVALDTGAPPSRQEFILGDSGAVALLVKKTSTSSLGFRSPAPLLEIDLEGLASLSSSPPKLARPVTPDDTCYCLYTSGTTGTPKGCLITHDNTVQAMLAFQDLFSGHWDGSSRWLQFASLHFDVSVLEQYWSWSVGITVVSAPRDLILSDLVRTISELDITHIDLTPSLARLVHPDEVPSLCKGVFITGGEQLRQDILDVWGSKSVIYNAYGPTEATIGVTMYQRVPQNGRSSNIGRQFLNVGSFVLQPGTDIPVLKGGVGELCVSGKLVGRGYLNRDELTEERFPTLKRYDTRVYRTGDLVRVLHDGCFDFLGRADDQVKLRGQRLEIGEINHAIRAGVSEVLDVATLVTKHGSQDRDVLVTFIVASSSNNKDRELATLSDPLCRSICGAAQDACRAKLPGYMVPTYVLAVPFIPLSANNKAQTNMLKGIFNNTTLEQLRRMAAAPGDEGVLLSLMEPRLAGILAEVTGFDEGQILTSSTIFELGFDSISVVALARRLQEAGFNGADPSTILQHPRLADLRKRLREASDTTITSQVVPINQAISAFYHKNLGAACEALGVSRGDISYVAPCTALQEGMLSRSAVAEGQETYFNTFRLELKPDISNERLRSAWKTVVDNNAILRTCFLQTPDGHAQVSLKSPGFSWSDHRLHEEDIGEYLLRRYTNWVRANETNVVRPYEIDSIGYNNNHILIVRMFHGIYDARSLEIILHNVKAAYEEAGQLTGPPFFDVLPHGPLCNFDASRPFWLERFDGFIPHPISGLTNHTQEADVTQSRVLAFGGLDSRRMSLGVTQQAVIQAAWLFVLKQNYPNWPAVGVIFSGRSLMLEGVNNTVGPLFNTLPFRVRDSSVKDWPGLILETHQFNSSALPFVHTPLRRIQKWCSRGRPLFDTLFSFGRDNTSLPLDKNIWAETGGMSKADYPLACEVVMTTDGKLRATLVAQGHISGLTGLDELLDGLEKALSSAISQDTFPGQDAPSVGPLDLHLDEVGHDSDNGEAPTQPPSEFMWDEEARMLRREIATLAEIDIEQVMEDTNLLELGLDSIDAVKLVARLRRLGTSVTTGQLMKQPTIRAILENHQNSRPNGDQKRSPRYELTTLVEKLRGTLEDNDHASQDAEAVLPPTPLQDSMVAEMIQSDFQRYFSHDVLELSPGTDLGRVQEAIRNVISQSPILRSCFVAISNPEINFAYCQVVHRDIDAFQPLVSLDNLDSWGSILEQARARAAIAQGRSNLLQLSPFTVQDRQFIVLSISHALYDGVSLDLFHQDVLAAYHGKYQKRKSYEDVLGCILTSSHDTAKKFWSGFLHGANTTLVVEREDAVIEADMMHRVEISSATEPSYVRAFCKKRAITTQTLGQSCWAAVLSTLVQSLDVTFGVVLSGRDTDEAQDLMFPTMNTVPVRVVLHGTVEEYIQYVWGNLSAINEFQHFPLRAAQKLVGRGPLFNTLFTMQTQTQANQRELSPIWESIQSASQVEYPICVEMELTEDRLLWRLACDLHYMTRDKADDILHQIDQVMSYLVRGDGKSTISLDPHGQVSVCSLPQFQVADTMSRGAPQPRVEFEQNERGSERREIESKVIEVLADISKVDRSAITADQSIYHLGLDSISAIKVSSVLRKKGLQISVRDMVKAASIRDFTYIASQKSGPQNTVSSLRPTQQLKALTEVDLPALLSRAGLSPDVVEKTLPALPVQAHFLTQWQNTGGQLFLYDFFYEASGSVSKEAVEHAWHVLVSEAPILRTQFIATGLSDIPFVQAILRAQQEPSDAISDRGDGNADWCFDGRAGSFAHLTAVHKRGEASVELRLRIHHALYDGVSLPLMAERFRELCQDRTLQADHYAPLWEDFVLQHYALEAREQRKAFWVQYLRGATTAPTRPSTPDKSSRTSEFQPAALHQISALRTLASQNGVSLQALFFAAHGRVLAKRRGLEVTRDDVDVVFGVYLANRTSYDGRLERTLYPTVSIVPLRIQIRASDSLAAVAARIQKDIRAISSFENATVGLWEIEQWTGVRLDSFVNFLHLPSRDEAVGQGDEVEGVLLREKKENDAAYSHELPTPDGMAQPTDDWLARNPVRETYVDAVDVEAAINGESLDVGVFSSAALLSTSEAASWVDELVGHLGSV